LSFARRLSLWSNAPRPPSRQSRRRRRFQAVEVRCQPQRAEHGALLGLVCLHPLENIVEYAHRLMDVRPLVEHYALGAVSHGSIGDFRTRRRTLLGQIFEHLGRPDCRAVRSLADPENLLLCLGQALVATFDRQIPSRNHHSDAFMPHRGEQQRGQTRKAALRFNLEHNPGPSVSVCVELLDELEYIGFPIREDRPTRSA
jgi:hypothetical protein